MAIVHLYKGEGGAVAVLSIDGKEQGGYRLDIDARIEIDNEYGQNTVVITDGRIYVECADCKDQICVEHAPIGCAHELIVCLPHRLVIEIKGGKEAQVDAITR